MKKILKINLIIIFILIALLNISGCKGSKKEDKNLKEKLNAEISYIDNELVTILNKLNDIEYVKYKVIEQEGESIAKGNESNESESGKQSSGDKNSKENTNENGENQEEDKKEGSSEESSKKQEDSKSSNTSNKTFSMKDNSILGKQTVDINWDELKSKIENLYTTWITVSNDLKQVGVPEEMLDSFSEKIDFLAYAIKNYNKEETLNNVIMLYEYLPKFVEIYTDDEKSKNVLYSKYNLLLCYKHVNLEKWDELQNSLSDLKKSFSNISDKKDEYTGKSVNISNASIIIKEMNNTVNIKEKDIFFIKYKNLIQELNIIGSL